MLSVSTLIEFLMNLLRDENAQAEFDQDPQATLARNGLQGVTGQDVRDAQLIMADSGSVRPKADHRSSSSDSDDDDPVRQIHHTRKNYEVDHHAPAHHAGLSQSADNIDQTFNIVNIDDRDTLLINDSFNEDNDITVVEDSFNSDVDITDSVLAGGDLNGPVEVNSNDTTEVDVVAVNAENSFNEDNSQNTLEVVDSFNDQLPQPDAGQPAPGAAAADQTTPDQGSGSDTVAADAPAAAATESGREQIEPGQTEPGQTGSGQSDAAQSDAAQSDAEPADQQPDPINDPDPLGSPEPPLALDTAADTPPEPEPDPADAIVA